MALRLYPFRQYNETDVINLFANQVVDDNPSTDGNGSAGVMVKVLSGNMNQDTFDLIGSDYLGKTDYPFLGADNHLPPAARTFTRNHVSGADGTGTSS